MTAKKIVKLLEWCIKSGYRNYYDTDIALDLFYQQQKNIDDLKDIDDLKHELKVMIEGMRYSADKINEQIE